MRRGIWVIMMVMTVTLLIGCGGKNNVDSSDETVLIGASEEDASVQNSEMMSDEISEQESETESETESDTESDTADYTFADLSKRQFEFSSGAGGWATQFTIEKDGYFKGNYHDSDMGVTGDGYENGTVYCCSFSGHFTDWTQIDENCYEMTLSDITYDDEIGKEEIVDNTYYIYTDAYGLEGTEKFRVYFPGTPVDTISTEVYDFWLSFANNNESELTMICIENVDELYGIYSYKRVEPLEDAQMNYNAYHNSYEYYNEQLKNTTAQMEMTILSERQYEIADDCLNYIWDLIKYNTEDAEFQTILTEQRKWIADKNQKESELLALGGSAAPMDSNEVLADMTMERCEQLIHYLE